MKICICGGGSLGHVCTSIFCRLQDIEVNLFTQHPERWQHEIQVEDCHGNVFQGHLNLISHKPEEVVTNSDIVLLCLPGYAIKDTLKSIRPHIGHAIIGSIVSSTGFFFFAHEILGHSAKLFGFQRVPFIARTAIYGQSASLLGYKPQIAAALENINDPESFRKTIESLWKTPCRLLDNYYEASLTNSNPILHTGRLYSMWKDWEGEVYLRNPYFYQEWTDEASQTILEMDAEFQTLLRTCPVTPNAIPSLLDYYECHNIKSLTHKIRHIPAFRHITAPMKEAEGGWVPDLESRYFAEDFPYGLRFIWQLSHEKGIAVPTIDKVYEWGITLKSKTYNRKRV